MTPEAVPKSVKKRCHQDAFLLLPWCPKVFPRYHKVITPKCQKVPEWLPRVARWRHQPCQTTGVGLNCEKKKVAMPTVRKDPTAPAGQGHPAKRTDDVMLSGRRQRAQPIRFAAPPQGKQGVSGSSHHALQNLHSLAGLPTAAGPSKLEPKMLYFSSLNYASISARLFHANFAKMVSKRNPIRKPASVKIKQKCRLNSNMQNTFKK